METEELLNTSSIEKAKGGKELDSLTWTAGGRKDTRGTWMSMTRRVLNGDLCAPQQSLLDFEPTMPYTL